MGTPFSLRSFAGGLNTRDLPSALQADECQALENVYTDDNALWVKRGGMQMLQAAPVNPTVYQTDANTLALYHLDGFSTGTIIPDASGNNKNMTNFNPGGSQPTFVPGLLADAMSVPLPVSGGNTGANIALNNVTIPINGLTALTVEAWLFLNPLPTFADVVNGGVSWNPVDGSSIFSWPGPLSGISHGLYFRQAVNPETGVFQNFLQGIIQTGGTNGNPSLNTTVYSGALPISTWFHARLTYDGASGTVALYINGAQVAVAVAQIPGPLFQSNGDSYMGTNLAPFGTATPSGTAVFPGLMDEVRISNIVRTDWPFYALRGKGFEFWKSDGTHQFVVAAEQGLFYNTGNGGWVRMVNPATNPTGVFQFNTVSPNYWDMVQFGDFLYLSDGLNTPQVWDGQNLYDWGNPSVPPNPTLLPGSTGPTAGQYQFCYTFLYGTAETGISPIATIQDPSGLQIQFSAIPWRASNCTGIRFYVMPPGSSSWYLWRELDNIVGQSQQISGPFAQSSPGSYESDAGAYGVPNADLGETGYPAIAADPLSAVTYNWKYLLVQGRRLLCCGHLNEPYNIRWSELDNPDVFQSYSFVPANSGAGPLNGMGRYYGDVLASRNSEAMLVLRGTDPSSWDNLELLHPTIGCLDHWGFVQHYPTIPPGDPSQPVESSDRYVLCFPASDGFYAYEGSDLRKISDKINPTYAQIAQGTQNRLDWVIDTEAGFESNLSQGGSATANVQDNQYENDGIRQTPGRMGLFNQLDYLGLWSTTDPLVPGRVLALCALGDGQFLFSTDYDGSLYRTTDNFNTVTKLAVNAAFGSGERIIEICQGPTGNFLCLTDTQDLTQICTIPNATSAGGPGPIQVSTAAWSVGLNNSPNVVTQYVDVYAPPTATTGIQTPIISGLAVTSVPSNTQINVASIPVDIPAGSFVTDPGRGGFSGGGKAYVYNSVSNSWGPALAVQDGPNLFYDLDVPVYRSANPPLSDQNQNPVANYPASGLIYNMQFLYPDSIGGGAAFGESAYAAYVNHRQDAVFSLYCTNYNTGPGPAQQMPAQPFWLQMLPAADSPFDFQGLIANDWPGNNDLLQTLAQPAPFGALGNAPYPNMPPGFWAFVAFNRCDYYPQAPGSTATQWYTTAVWSMYYTFRQGPQWLGGTQRPQCFWDAVNSQWVFVASTSEVNGNRASYVRTVSGAGGQVNAWPTQGGSGDSAPQTTRQCVSSICDDGAGNLYSARAYFQFNSEDGGQGVQFALSKWSLADLGAGQTWDNATIPANVVPLRMGYDAVTGLIVWTDKNFNQQQEFPSSTGQNWWGFAGDVNATSGAGPAEKTLTFNTTTYNQTEPLDTAFYCELAYQTDSPGGWVVACNQPDGVTPAFSYLAQPLSATTDVESLQIEPYEGVTAAGPGTGVLSNLVFEQASGAANNYLWADRVYFSTSVASPTDSRMVQLGVPGDWTVQGQYVSPYEDLGSFLAFAEVSTDATAGDFTLYLRNAATPGALAASEVQVTANQPITTLIFNPTAALAQWRIAWTWTYSIVDPTDAPYCTYVDVGYYLLSSNLSIPRLTGWSWEGRAFWSVAIGQQDENDLVLVWQKTRTWTTHTGWNVLGLSQFNEQFCGIQTYGWVALETGLDDLGEFIQGVAQSAELLGVVAVGQNDQPTFATIAKFLGQLDKLISKVQANVQSQVASKQPAWLILTPYAGNTPLPNSAWAIPFPPDTAPENVRVHGRPSGPSGRFGYDWARAFSILLASSAGALGGPYAQVLDAVEIVQAIDLEIDLTEVEYDLPVK